MNDMTFSIWIHLLSVFYILKEISFKMVRCNGPALKYLTWLWTFRLICSSFESGLISWNKEEINKKQNIYIQKQIIGTMWKSDNAQK